MQSLTRSSIGHRIELRKKYHHRLCRISDIMCFLGLFGIILMIINNEIIFASDHDDETFINWFIKLIISISTIFLIGFIIYYHKVDLNFYSLKNSVADWRIGLTGTKIFLIIFEIFICLIHPFPRFIHSKWIPCTNNITQSLPLSYISLDVALGLPMFARFYLICRLIMFHSLLIHSASSQSLGSFNQVSMNFFFVIKTYLEQWPTRCLIIFCTVIFLVGSWSLRACNYHLTTTHVPMLDSMWLFIVTFTTVGYGDYTPSTYCGRTVAAVIASTGMFASALLISVLAQKLVLTRWEKYLNNFILNIQLVKARKDQIANVIKFAVQVWYFKRKNQSKSIQFFQAQWKLFRSIQAIQNIKLNQRKLYDNSIVLADLYTLQRDESNKTEKIIQQIDIINRNINNIHYKLNLLLNKYDDIIHERIL